MVSANIFFNVATNSIRNWVLFVKKKRRRKRVTLVKVVACCSRELIVIYALANGNRGERSMTAQKGHDFRQLMQQQKNTKQINVSFVFVFVLVTSRFFRRRLNQLIQSPLSLSPPQVQIQVFLCAPRPPFFLPSLAFVRVCVFHINRSNSKNNFYICF